MSLLEFAFALGFLCLNWVFEIGRCARKHMVVVWRCAVVACAPWQNRAPAYGVISSTNASETETGSQYELTIPAPPYGVSA